MKAKVFISSVTSLQTERRMLSAIVEGLGHEPLRWESGHLDSGARTTEEMCLKTVAQCDVVIAVFGLLPGSRSSVDGLTVFQLEVKRARELGIPLLIFYKKELANALRTNRSLVNSQVIKFDGYLTSRKAPPCLIYEFGDNEDIEQIVKNFLSEEFRRALWQTRNSRRPKVHKTVVAEPVPTVAPKTDLTFLSMLLNDAKDRAKRA